MRLAWLFPLLLLLLGCQEGVLSYQAYLDSQVKEFKPIPADLVEVLQPYYDVDLTKVQIAENIETLSNYNTVVGYKIYYTKPLVYAQPKMQKNFLHELRHVEHYQDNPLTFEAQYLAQVPLAVLRLREARMKSVHENMDFEMDAQEKSEYVYEEVFRACKIYCAQSRDMLRWTPHEKRLPHRHDSD